MNLRKISLWIVIFILVLSTPVFAFDSGYLAKRAEIQPEGTRARKLQRGFLNVALSPLELSKALAEQKNKDTIIPSWVYGLGKGSFLTLRRAMVGGFDILTSPVASNSILESEFPMELVDKS